MPDRSTILDRAPPGEHVYLALGALLAVGSLADALASHHQPSVASATIAIAAALCVGLCASRPLAAALVLAALATAVGLADLSDAAPTISFVPPAICAYACGAGERRAWAVVAGLGLVAGLEVASTSGDGTWVPQIYLVLGPLAVGQIVSSRREIVARLEHRTEELEREREAFAALAARRERARMARELHDIVSHNMALMIIQAGAGRLSASDDPDLSAETFRRIRVAGQATLSEIDQLVDVLGLHSVSGSAADLAAVGELVARARAAGLDVQATVELGHSQLPPELERAAFRAIQEGLTNVLKHAPGARVDLRVDSCDGELRIEVRDRGSAGNGDAPLTDSGSGSGLDGIRDRVRGHGGELVAGPLPHGGWGFAVRLPVGVRETARTTKD